MNKELGTAVPARLGQRAIVMGSSMAGLMAARVLSGHFDEVWLLERDVLPDTAAHRKGTPHAMHAHGLLAKGLMIMEDLYPGLLEALKGHGASSGDLGEGTQIIAGMKRLRRGHAGARSVGVSRIRLEAELRRRTLSLPNVVLHAGVDVHGLEMSADGRRVQGVHVRPHGAQDPSLGEARTMHADLILDATGRASRSPQWLKDAGFDAPEEERVGVKVGYATMYFERGTEKGQDGGARDPLKDLRVVICSLTPAQPTGAVMVAQEPDGSGPARWVVTMGSMGKGVTIDSLEQMREHAARLNSPELLHVLQHARPLTEMAAYQFSHSQRRHYQRIERFPERYLVMGDAVASFNPIYAQGMSSAACQAVALRGALAGGLDPALHRHFFKAASRIIDTPWQTAVATDLAFDSVPGERPLAVRFRNAYVRRVQIAAQYDAALAVAFMRVGHLLAPPSSLFKPSVLLRVVWHNLREAFAAEPAAWPNPSAGGRRA
jgi:2-polyprenyl-6-methoxyphenol hydroxylase-like FAD-dependent oxidoreductase